MQKIMNKTCHFCKNATNKKKISCENDFCSRVYCYRNNCLKKLRQTYGSTSILERYYDRSEDDGLPRFICPHCKDSSRCLSNYCRRKNAGRKLPAAQLRRIEPPNEFRRNCEMGKNPGLKQNCKIEGNGTFEENNKFRANSRFGQKERVSKRVNIKNCVLNLNEVRPPKTGKFEPPDLEKIRAPVD
ncbi:hypothetical protein MHBO_002064 [Bonamia ostreae]|uniref:Zinc-finger domain-containing protein n=1 Tax=Bonamia ostreae TaxID=126728 RepID=A0ABV2AL44_9EUKA